MRYLAIVTGLPPSPPPSRALTRHLDRVDHLAHRIQRMLHTLHAVLQRDQPSRTVWDAPSTREQRASDQESRGKQYISVVRRTAALNAISLHALTRCLDRADHLAFRVGAMRVEAMRVEAVRVEAMRAEAMRVESWEL